MKNSFYRTKHRALILRTVKEQPRSVTLIHLLLKKLFEAGELKRLPSVRQIYRSVSDLRQSGLLVADRVVGGVCYYRHRKR